MNKVFIGSKHKIINYILGLAGVAVIVVFGVMFPSIQNDLAFSQQKKAGVREYWEKALASEQKGDLTQAIWNFRKFLDLKGDNKDAFIHLAKLYVQTGQLSQALDYAQKFTQSNPKSPDGFFYSGVTYDILGQKAKAKESYQKTVSIDPQYAEAYFNLGFLSESDGQFLQAIEFYKKTIEVNPKHAKAFYNLGNAYAGLERNQEAMEAYQHAVTLDPNYMDAFVNLSILLAKAGEYAQAIKNLDEARVLGYDPPEEYLKSLEPYREVDLSKKSEVRSHK